MGRAVIVYGKSGSGKSRSLKNFGEDEIFLINVTSKDLPFRKKFKYTFKSDRLPNILNGLVKMPTNVAVIDDATFLMTNTFMREHATTRDNFGLYNSIADGMYHIFELVPTLPEDVIVYIILHEEENDNGQIKLRTIGKLLDQKFPMEAQVTICLRCMTDGDRHYFRTQSTGNDISKSPEEMFGLEIENDLAAVDTVIREYYGLEPRRSVKQ